MLGDRIVKEELEEEAELARKAQKERRDSENTDVDEDSAVEELDVKEEEEEKDEEDEEEIMGELKEEDDDDDDGLLPNGKEAWKEVLVQAASAQDALSTYQKAAKILAYQNRNEASSMRRY